MDFSLPVVGELDHGTLDQQLTVSANTYIQCVNVTVSNDTVPEENEFFQILISSISRIASSTSIHQRYNVSAIVTIIDDDCKCIFTLHNSFRICHTFHAYAYNYSNMQSRVCEWSVHISRSLPM